MKKIHILSAVLSVMFLNLFTACQSSDFIETDALQYQIRNTDWTITVLNKASDPCKVYNINNEYAAIIPPSEAGNKRTKFIATDLNDAVVFDNEDRLKLTENLDRAIEIIEADENAFFDFSMIEEDFMSKMNYNKNLAELDSSKDSTSVKSFRIQCYVQDSSSSAKKIKSIIVAVNGTSIKFTIDQLHGLRNALKSM